MAEDATDRLVAAAMRLVDKGMYSKNSTLRVFAATTAGQLAYVRPAAVLPFILERFMAAVEHSTATHQLTSALSVLTCCLRPMLLAPAEAGCSLTVYPSLPTQGLVFWG
jgi:proteasome activator subunit 4